MQRSIPHLCRLVFPSGWIGNVSGNLCALCNVDRLSDFVTPVASYATAVLIALACTATVWLVIAAKTKTIPLYSNGFPMAAMLPLFRNASLANETWDGEAVRTGGRILRRHVRL